MKRAIYTIIILLDLVIFPVLLQSQATADYGDAPDSSQHIKWWGSTAKFLTLKNNFGPSHSQASASTYWIGKPGTRPFNTTTQEADALVTDNDNDDGQPFIWVVLVGIPAPATVTVPITTSKSHNPNQTIYVNVCIDVDNDLDFDDRPDPNWVVKNKPVKIPADTSVGVTFGGFGFGSDLILFPVWLRVTLTDNPVPYPWYGQGANWIHGETEDWWYVAGRGGGGRPPQPGNPGQPGRGRGGIPLPSGKCVKVNFPPVVYVKCDQTVCFSVTIKNCGSVPASNINVGFSPTAGTPLPRGPTIMPPPNLPIGNIPPGGSVTLRFCIRGWPCESEAPRWTKYKINLSYDPDGLYCFSEYEIDFHSLEDPVIDAQMTKSLGIIPVVDSLDSPEWEGTINQQMVKGLMALTGNYQWGGQRWIIGQPIINPIYIPKWAIFSEIQRFPDQTLYSFVGTPGNKDNGLDSAVFEVLSDDLIQDTAFKKWRMVVPIIINNINNPPEFVNSFEPTIKIDVAKKEKIDIMLEVTDKDRKSGKRDSVEIDYYLINKKTNSLYFPVPEPIFLDSACKAKFEWSPTQKDTGNYSLTAICWDYYYGFDSTVTDLNIVSSKLYPDFKIDTNNGYTPFTVKFTDLSTAYETEIKSWRWDFGDGDTSLERNPVHTYKIPGLFGVELTVSDGVNYETEAKYDLIDVKETVKADFIANPTSGTAPLTVNFSDYSTGSIISRLWEFGDESTSIEQNPSHTYNNAGDYTVKLKVSDGTMQDSIIKKDFIQVNASEVNEFNYSELFFDISDIKDNSQIIIKYNLPVSGNVEFSIFNSIGKEIYSYTVGYQNAGINMAELNLSEKLGFTPVQGIYIVCLKLHNEKYFNTICKPLILLR